MINASNPPINQLLIRHLGLIDYQECLALQQALIQHQKPLTQHELWVLQHPSVYTQGQAGAAEHILNPGTIPCVQSDRGGQVTYHGPGQIVFYCLFDLQRLNLNVRTLVDSATRSMIAAISGYEIAAYDDRYNPGVYSSQGKLASLGFRVRKHMSYHGIAVNFDLDLRPFSGINPCGLKQPVTSIRRFNKDVSEHQFISSCTDEVIRHFGFTESSFTYAWP